jgi:hypothetical protein
VRTRTPTVISLLLILITLLAASACAAKATPTPTATPVPTVRPTSTTIPPTPTPFYTRSPLMTPESGTRAALPAVQCQSTPQWGLGDVWNRVKDSVGCPTGDQGTFQGQEVSFQSGFMIWRGDLRVLYVLYYTGEPRLEMYRDTYVLGETPAAPLPTPTRGALGQLIAAPVGPFEKLWREVEGVRERLGWCVSADAAQDCTVKTFEGIAQDCELGTLLWNRESAFALFFSDMSWEMY